MDEAVEEIDPATAEAPPEGAASVLDGVTGRRLRLIGIALVLAVLAILLLGLVRSAVQGPSGPWLGEYFDNQEFEGEPLVRYTRKVEFEWDKERPVQGMPKDKWSAIYTTCLEVEEEAEFRFRLTSDDGSRLFVDGEKLIDNWGPHSPRTRTGKMLFEPGTYAIEVEYFDAAHGAVLKLVVAIGEDAEHESLPPDMLRQPSGDPERPCG